MVTGPATFVVMLIVGLLLVAGVIVLGAGAKRVSRGDSRSDVLGAPTCPHCGHRNAPQATYCAQCGSKLTQQKQ